MGKFKDEGDPALALAEECAEVIQCINKTLRFGGDWSSKRPDVSINRFEELELEMDDLFYQWTRLKSQVLQKPVDKVITKF